ncbi:hypothetical protein LTR82_003727 [Friedmanniomyces endolithicus]|uniref:Nickel/cobalt efflux system n=1 Tax=Friedmanniomyces endolithicus TaxID=329885 RepID=A0AAN6G085_9PEZI|nr:hypothetical protein LTR82_003727 [Friedmanniomyces endolithicus]
MRSGRLLMDKLQHQAEGYQARVPWIRRLPASAVAIVLPLMVVNISLWIACAIILSYHPGLVSTAVIAWTLGLRHAIDADHISAIDLMTSRLVASGQRPVTVGTFFSLSHLTIVIATCIIVAASSAAISDRFGAFSDVGGIIGGSVSAGVLILFGVINGWILYKLVEQLRRAISVPVGQQSLDFNFEGGGCMMQVLRKMFKLVDKPWKMYPLGVLFGLGFDTSSEIALLGISSIQAAQGTSIWLILIFPLLFTAGMCMLDTFDGAAMMSLYTSARLAKDAIAVLYYQCVLTAVTVAVALVIGMLQLLTLTLRVKPDLTGDFWRGVKVAGNHSEIIGGGVCGSFVVVGPLSVLIYRPWRTMIDRRREVMHPIADSALDSSREDNTTAMQSPSMNTTKSHAIVAKNGTPHHVEEREREPEASARELNIHPETQ